MNTPFVLVIFGATGDLAVHKLMPALFSFFKKKQLPEEFFIVGFSRRDLTSLEFADFYSDLKKDNEKEWADFSKHLIYQQGLFNEEKGYSELINKLSFFDKKLNACITRIFYLATPPENYENILNYLHNTKLSEGCGQGSSKWTRIAIEKPFGKDLDTSRMLDKKLAQIFEEKQIFRVDHYLAKETVQNMLIFRFANGIFEPVWNKDYIDYVQITWAETKGVETRGQFFDGVGLLRDVGQSHLMQLVAAVGMESPVSFSKDGVRDARTKAIQAIKCIEPDSVSQNVVFGQYRGYKSEKDVDLKSNTETFVALKLNVNTPRFEGVPFYIRAGKKMPQDLAEIKIVFKQVCHILFKEIGCPEEENVLTIRIQPDEGIRMHVIVKKPGENLELGAVDMKFSYKEEFNQIGANAYEKIILDIFSGDQILFNRSDELDSSWEFITKILQGMKTQGIEVDSYESDSWGPESANKLIEKDGKKWIL